MNAVEEVVELIKMLWKVNLMEQTKEQSWSSSKISGVNNEVLKLIALFELRTFVFPVIVTI